MVWQKKVKSGSTFSSRNATSSGNALCWPIKSTKTHSCYITFWHEQCNTRVTTTSVLFSSIDVLYLLASSGSIVAEQRSSQWVKKTSCTIILDYFDGEDLSGRKSFFFVPFTRRCFFLLISTTTCSVFNPQPQSVSFTHKVLSAPQKPSKSSSVTVFSTDIQDMLQFSVLRNPVWQQLLFWKYK